MEIAFNWFLGKNRLKQIVYNPCTYGCYDGLEETHVNLNQGAESTVSYLMARLTVEKYKKSETKNIPQLESQGTQKSRKEDTLVPVKLKNQVAFSPYYFITNSFGITKKEGGPKNIYE